MKNSLYILAILFVSFSSCVKDNSVTKARELDDIRIGGIAENYSVSLDESLNISPTISKEFTEEADLEYLWYAFNQQTQNGADTLSKEKNLSRQVPLAPGKYTLVLKVTNKNTGVFYKVNTELTVINDYTPGLMILTENNGEADLAFYNTGSEKFIENVYARSNGESLGAAPVGIYYYAAKGSMPAEVLILCKDQRGGVVADPLTFTKFRDIRNSFYVPLEETGDLNVEGYIPRSTSGLQDYLVMDGQVYNRAANAGEVLFRPPLLGVTYSCSPVSFNASSRPAFFDELNGRFLAQPGTNAEISTFITKQFPEIIDPDEVKMDLLFGANVSGATFFTLFENKEHTKRYILKFLASASSRTFRGVSNYEITAAGIMQATAFAGASSFQNYLFYAVNNQIYVYNVDSETGSLLTSLGSQSSINFLELEGTELRVGYTDQALAGKKGCFATYTIGTVGGISATADLKKEGFCDKVIDISSKK